MDSYLRNPSLNWTYFYQGKGLEELRHSLLYTTLELESTRIEAQEEIKRREDQVNHLKDLLDKTIRERDEAQAKCQRLVLDKLVILQQLQLQHHHNHNQTTPIISGISSIEDEARRGDSNAGISSSDCEESIVSSPAADPLPPQPAMMKALPEKGKLLQAVMKAGPLLQTLLLAGPLPQWRHPPPPLDSFEIPPVAIPSTTTPQLLNQQASSATNYASVDYKKRNLLVCEEPDLSSESKSQRVRFH